MSNNNDYTAGNLLDFAYFKVNYRLIAIDLSKQTKLKDPQQISFIGKLENQDHGATIFFNIEKSQETTFIFSQNPVQKIVNLLNGSDNENSKFATKKWYIIDSESKGNYSQEDEIKFLTSSLESSLCDYSDAYILVTGNITVKGGNNNTKVAFKNCTPFEKSRTEMNETFVDGANFINIAMTKYNLIGYSDNYSDTSGSLWQFKGDEIEDVDLTIGNAPSFKYKGNLIGNTENNGRKNVKIAILSKYLSNFWTSLEMQLINCKVEFSLKWYEECIISSAGTAATFKITDANLYVPIATLKTENNTKLSKLLSKGFKRPISWNKYKIIFKNYNANEYIRERLDARGVHKLFVLPYASGDNITTENSYRNILVQDLR